LIRSRFLAAAYGAVAAVIEALEDVAIRLEGKMDGQRLDDEAKAEEAGRLQLRAAPLVPGIRPSRGSVYEALDPVVYRAPPVEPSILVPPGFDESGNPDNAYEALLARYPEFTFATATGEPPVDAQTLSPDELRAHLLSKYGVDSNFDPTVLYVPRSRMNGWTGADAPGARRKGRVVVPELRRAGSDGVAGNEHDPRVIRPRTRPIKPS